MMIEIVFTYQDDKYSKITEGYTYYFTKEEDLKKSIASAGKYYTKFLKENGWTRKAKLKSIAKAQNDIDPATIKKTKTAAKKPAATRTRSKPATPRRTRTPRTRKS